MQMEHEGWQKKNFAANATGDNSFLGMMEEMGEMAHAMLKLKQGIRDMDYVKARELIIDGHCDLIIFSFGLANDLGYDLESELQLVWDKVKQRDWVTNPSNAHEVADQNLYKSDVTPGEGWVEVRPGYWASEDKA
jgi:NTP pyrophosphatase (non-canonical NTP hydrolase)